MRKLLLPLLSILLSCSAWAEDVEIDGVKFSLNEETKEASVIGGYAYYSGDVIIPSFITYSDITYNVTSVGNDAFFKCTGLTSVMIPNSVTCIGSGAFNGCICLTSIEIPNSVTSIGESAFEGCVGLISVEIPNSVTSIGVRAFESCSNLTSIEIPNGVTNIDTRTFLGCSNLTSVEIPNGVTSIGNSAFSGCTGLTSIKIPSSVTSIGNSALYFCTNLASITCEAITPPTCGSICFYEVDKSVCILHVPAESIELYKRANQWNDFLTIESIKNSIDGIYYNLNPEKQEAEVTFGDIGYSGSVSIPSSITVSSITYNVTSIGESAFKGCTGLTSIVIPNGVTSISATAFGGCTGLTSVTIPNSVTSIGHYAFNACKSLTSIEIPNSVTSIGSSAFSGCTGLTSIEIPNSVIRIEYWAFNNCSAIKSVTLGSGIENIGTKAFANCKKLEDVYCYAVRYPTTTDDIFENSYIEFVTLHVPEKSVNQYKSKTPWSGFMEVVTIEGEEYFLTIRLGEGGITRQPVEKDQSYTFEFIPDEGWTVNTLTFNGQDMTSQLLDGQFSTPVITGDAELNVVFKQEASNIKSMKQTETSMIKVYAYKGTIKVVEAEDGTEVEVYNAGGMLVANGEGNCSISLDSGIYIVKVGNETFKVSL